MTATPEQKEILQRGERMERLVITEDWAEFTTLATKQRDQWLSHTAISQDRVYLAAQAATVNVLLSMPFSLIDQKNQLLADLKSLPESEEKEEEFVRTHPAPQAV